MTIWLCTILTWVTKQFKKEVVFMLVALKIIVPALHTYPIGKMSNAIGFEHPHEEQ